MAKKEAVMRDLRGSIDDWLAAGHCSVAMRRER